MTDYDVADNTGPLRFCGRRNSRSNVRNNPGLLEDHERRPGEKHQIDYKCRDMMSKLKNEGMCAGSMPKDSSAALSMKFQYHHANNKVNGSHLKSLLSVKSASRPTSASTMSTCSGGSYTSPEGPRPRAPRKRPASGRLKAAAIAWLEQKRTKETELEKAGAKLNSDHNLKLQRHEEAYSDALANFDDHWEQRLAEFDEHQEDEMKTFQENQREVHKQHMEKVRSELEPRNPKWSTECLRTMKSVSLLEKQQRFVEAEIREGKVAELKDAEQRLFDELREKRIAKLEEAFLQKQARAVQYMRERQEAERRKLVTRQSLERRRVMFHHSKNMQKAQTMKWAALARHDKKVINATFTRHGQLMHPDLDGVFRPTWEGTRGDNPYLDFASPEIL